MSLKITRALGDFFFLKICGILQGVMKRLYVVRLQLELYSCSVKDPRDWTSFTQRDFIILTTLTVVPNI